MNIDVDYLFDSELPMPNLASEISHQLGCKLTLDPTTDPTWPETIYRSWFFGMRMMFENHSYENDGDTNFENYRYALSVESGFSGTQIIQIEVMAMIASVLKNRPLNILRGMLVYDLQTVLARYEPRGHDWFDLVSDKVVTYPDHLVDIRSRIDRAG